MQERIEKLEKSLAMTESMWRAEKAQRQKLERKLADVAGCGKCHRIKRVLCFVACPAVEARLQG